MYQQSLAYHPLRTVGHCQSLRSQALRKLYVVEVGHFSISFQQSTTCKYIFPLIVNRSALTWVSPVDLLGAMAHFGSHMFCMHLATPHVAC